MINKTRKYKTINKCEWGGMTQSQPIHVPWQVFLLGPTNATTFYLSTIEIKYILKLKLKKNDAVTIL